MKLKADTTTAIVSPILQTYPEQNSASPKLLQKVLEDVRNLSDKSFEKEGLILWSHGNAWLPQGEGLYSDRDKTFENKKKNDKKRSIEFASFGADHVLTPGKYEERPKEMDIKEGVIDFLV